MGLQVWYPTDIHNALLAAEQATVTALGDNGKAEYRRGYLAALTTLALAFGLARKVVEPTWYPIVLSDELRLERR